MSQGSDSKAAWKTAEEIEQAEGSIRAGYATEDAEQTALFRWAAYNSRKYPELELMFHIPNGGKRGKAEAARFRAMGVRAGIPDIFLPAARGGSHGLFIEMKRIHQGRVSEDQKRMMARLEEAGYMCRVCRGWCEASEVIIKYLRG